MRDDKVMRSFDTGATRDTAEGKLDYEGFLSPAVLHQFAKYMNMNRLQSDGQVRDSDNWQKGIPQDAYMKSGYRHFYEWWAGHRYGDKSMIDRKPTMAALCGLLFNVMGYMHEELKRHPEVDFDGDEPTPEMKARQDGLRRKNASPSKPIDTQQKLIEYLDAQVDATFCGDTEVSDKCETCTPECDLCGEVLETPNEVMAEIDAAVTAPMVYAMKEFNRVYLNLRALNVEVDCGACVNSNVAYDKWPCYECSVNVAGNMETEYKHNFFAPKLDEETEDSEPDGDHPNW